MGTSSSRLAVWAVAALLALATSAHAQATTGRIAGTVRDASGAVMPGVTVTANEVRTGFTQDTVTDANGTYSFVSLPLGSYTVAAALEGFKTANKTGYELVADGRLTLDFVLEIRGAQRGRDGHLEGRVGQRHLRRGVAHRRSRAGAGRRAERPQLHAAGDDDPRRPASEHNALDIMTGLGINSSINGSRQNAGLLTVDGGFNMDSGSNNSQISNVGVDFIEQVSIKTSNFSAEYGRNSGAAINVVTRTGTNQFHGSVFDYVRRDNLDANDYFNELRGTALPELKYDNYGGAIGGPVLRDRSSSSVASSGSRSAASRRPPPGRCRRARCAMATSRR